MFEIKDLLQNEPLSRHCSFGVGGAADYFYKLKDVADLPELIAFTKQKKLPYIFLGGGSNTLFSDKGFRGLIIKNELKKITVQGDEVYAESGVTIAEFLKKSLEHNLAGLESWSGLPGTVGGAVRGNAGCNGLETSDILVEATLFNPRTGKFEKVKRDYFEFKYRNSKIKKDHKIVVSALFKLKKNELSPDEQKKKISEINKLRIEKQPFGLTCGSFFKNPSPNKPAGLLIDRVGLKGKKIGNAQISLKHGNFFLNLGGATSKDILELAKLAKHHVQAKFKVKLRPEVQIFSEKGPAKF